VRPIARLDDPPKQSLLDGPASASLFKMICGLQPC
jgi:hypothetical protein